MFAVMKCCLQNKKPLIQLDHYTGVKQIYLVSMLMFMWTCNSAVVQLSRMYKAITAVVC